MNFKYGLKLWSINENYAKIVKNIRGYFDYIELYIVPDSFDTYSNIWASLSSKFIIHAPHFMHGLNFSDSTKLLSNKKLVEESKKYADILSAKYIIYHPGINGPIEETARQVSEICDEKTLIENKPCKTSVKNSICTGHSVEEIKFIIENTKAGFCFDIGHAICAANSTNKEPFGYLEKFLELNPRMYHLTDGDFNGENDRHEHFGNGNYDIKKIISLIPDSSYVTVETYKNSKAHLDDFVQDIMFLRSL